MSPFPLMGGMPFRAALSTTLDPNGDDTIGGWEDEGGATTNLYQSVNDASDSTWVQLVTNVSSTTTQNDNVIFDMDDPSTWPNRFQPVKLRVRARIIQTAGPPLGVYSDMTARVKRLGTTVESPTFGALNTTWNNYEANLNSSSIYHFGVDQWDDLEIDVRFSSYTDDTSYSLTPAVSKIEVIFSP